MNIKTFIVSLLLAGLLLSGCATPSLPEAAPTVEPSAPVSQDEMTPPVASADFQTFTDPYAGISLNYPQGWFLESSALAHAEESIGYSVSFFSYDFNAPQPQTGKGQPGLPEGQTKIEIAIWKENQTLEQVIAQQREGGGDILAEEYVTLPNGLEAVILDFEGFAGNGRTLITNIGDAIVFVTAYGNLEPFLEIAMSLQTSK